MLGQMLPWSNLSSLSVWMHPPENSHVTSSWIFPLESLVRSGINSFSLYCPATPGTHNVRSEKVEGWGMGHRWVYYTNKMICGLFAACWVLLIRVQGKPFGHFGRKWNFTTTGFIEFLCIGWGWGMAGSFLIFATCWQNYENDCYVFVWKTLYACFTSKLKEEKHIRDFTWFSFQKVCGLLLWNTLFQDLAWRYCGGAGIKQNTILHIRALLFQCTDGHCFF